MRLDIRDIEVNCIIGEREDEREREQTLAVDLSLEVSASAAETDSIADAVDYVAAAEAVRKRLVEAKCQLIERAAREAAQAVAALPGVTLVRARVTKRGAVAGIGAASAEYLAGGDGAAQKSSDTVEIATRLVALLKATGRSCATAESCTGGGIGATITAVPGSSEVFQGGVISYSNNVKEGVLGVSGETLSRHGAVSSQCAAAMAEGARRLTHSDIAVSVTGIAGPGGGSPEKPVGLVWFGLATSGAPARTEKKLFTGDRAAVRIQAVRHALGMLTIAALG